MNNEIRNHIFNLREGSVLGASTELPTPVITSASTEDPGTEVILIYDLPIDETSIPSTSDYTVGTDNVTNISLTEHRVILTLEDGIGPGEEQWVSYTPGTNPIRSADGLRNVAALDQYPITSWEL